MHPPPAPADEIVAPLTVSVADIIERIESLVARESSFSFNGLLRRAKSRTEIVVTFLAVLELIKAHRVLVRQERLFGEIVILRAEDPPEALGAQESPEH